MIAGGNNNSINRRRYYKDKVAKSVVIGGGVFVLITLLLIFCYLFYVTQPIFSKPSAITTQLNPITPSIANKPVRLIGKKLTVYGIQKGISETPTDVFTGGRTVHLPESIPALSNVQVNLQVKGKLLTVLHDNISYHLPAELNQDPIVLQWLQQLSQITFDAQVNGQQLGILMGDGHRLFYVSYQIRVTQPNFFQSIAVDMPYQYAMVNPNLSRVVVTMANQLSIFHIHNQSVYPLYQVALNEFDNLNVDTIAPLGESIIVAGNQTLSIWSEIALQDRFSFQRLQQWKVPFDINTIAVNSSGGEFVVAGAEGQLAGLYPTDSNVQWQAQSSINAIKQIQLNQLADTLVVLGDDKIEWLEISNPHPDVSWSSLFGQVWYPGYAQPDYVWQTNSGDDGAVNRFSLIPLTFGTIKITLIAILFAIPIAVSAAVYSAFFMSPRIRNVVKPTIEMVEALPTVVLGFIAGLWLAPLIENHFVAIILIILGLPVAVLTAMFVYLGVRRHHLDYELHNWLPLLLIPLVFASVSLAFNVSPVVERWLFNGDVLHWMYLNFGIEYQQRNALVVGILMGFAIIPTIYTLSEEAIVGVPKHVTRGALALGASQWQTVRHVVLLVASPGIFAAIMIGFGRAIGETMVVLMATGNMPLSDWDILSGVRTLTANIAIEIPEANVGSSHYRVLFLSALLLLSITFVLNTLAEIIRQKLRQKYSEL